jgi:hypothetical protein
VVVEIGPDKIKYHVYKSLLFHHSGYFYKGLAGLWKEAREQVVTWRISSPLPVSAISKQ